MATALRLFADYHQIHVLDEGSTEDLGSVWSAKAVEDRLAAGVTAVAIGTETNEYVAVEVTLADASAGSLDAWQHVTECSLDVPSGRLVVMGCTDFLGDATRSAVAPGTWRLRASHRGLGTDAEEVHLSLWRAPRADSRVLKRWARPV